MKKLFIVNNNLHLGGVQRALVNLLWNIRGEYDVTLFLFYDGGILRNQLPPEVEILSAKSAYRWLGMNKFDAGKSITDWIMRGSFATITRIFGRKAAVALMKPTQPLLDGYDVAISYLHNSGDRSFYGGCNEFVLNHVNAKKKIAFVHGDFSSGTLGKKSAADYELFHRICACSQGCAQSFLLRNPQLWNRVSVVKNCHRFQEIQRLAEQEEIALPKAPLNVLTVARLGPEKGILRALEAVADLDLRFTVIGEGKERRTLEKFIEERKIGEKVSLLGELENPYPWMKQADVLLIPSYHEAAPLVIGEAASLGTAILTTETCSAREMVEEKGFGWVCENSAEGIRKVLNDLLEHPEIIENQRQTLHAVSHSNQEALEQFAAVMEGENDG